MSQNFLQRLDSQTVMLEALKKKDVLATLCCPLAQDPVFMQPCFVPQCSLATRVEPCPRTETTRPQSQPQVPASSASSA